MIGGMLDRIGILVIVGWSGAAAGFALLYWRHGRTDRAGRHVSFAPLRPDEGIGEWLGRHSSTRPAGITLAPAARQSAPVLLEEDEPGEFVPGFARRLVVARQPDGPRFAMPTRACRHCASGGFVVEGACLFCGCSEAPGHVNGAHR